MQVQSNTELAEAFKLQHEKLKDIDVDYIAFVVNLIKERATFISDFWNLSHYFFEAPKSYDEKASKKAFKEGNGGSGSNLLKQIRITSYNVCYTKLLRIAYESWSLFN